MKLKYYLRGLGIGVLLTTIILSIGNRPVYPTDEEIINKAKDLGMDFVQEEEVDNIEKILGNLDSKPEPSPTIGLVSDLDEDTQLVEKIEPTVIPVPTDISEPTKAIEPTDIPEAKYVSFTIMRGMTSMDVSEVLKEIGLIEDAEDFNRYVIGQGKAGVIRIGTFTLEEGASYQEIVDIIT